MAGNVWEWTASWYDMEQTRRVLRGGSWASGARYYRCALRFGLLPTYGHDDLGFRALVAPS
jgi:formylglycine-generating enzyme required for sulfatase activity